MSLLAYAFLACAEVLRTAWRRFFKIWHTPQKSVCKYYLHIYHKNTARTAQFGKYKAILIVKLLADLVLVDISPAAPPPSAIMRATYSLPPLMRSRILRLLLLNWRPQVII